MNYLRGVCLKYLGKPAEAYDAFRRAAWSNNVISPAMTQASAIAFGNGDYTAAYQHACAALEKEARNPVACVYAALAQWKLGDTRRAADRLRGTLALDPLNHLARYALCIVTGRGKAGFYTELHSNPAQTVLDLTGDLWTLGLWEDIVSLLRGALKLNPTHAMLRYTLAAALYEQGDPRTASRELLRASKAERIVDVFPFRAEEIDVLRFALGANPKDGFAAYLLGCALYHARKYEEAAELWETAIKYIPDFYIPYRNLALAYFNHLGREDDALPLMRRAVELHPNDGTLLTEAATVMQKLGTSAAENAAFLNEYKPDNVTDQIQLTIARAYNAAGQYDLAEQAMRSHTFSPGEGAEFTTAEPYMTACFQRGCLAMKEVRYEDALNAFLASQKMPENLNVGFWNESVMMPYLYYEAAARKALGQTEEAEKIIERLAGMKNVGMWNMGGEFLYYYAMAVRLGGNEMRAQKIMRDAILAWERELAGGCTYHRVGGGIYNCFIGDGPTARLATLHGMLGYGKLYNGDIAGAAEEFRKSLELSPSAKIAFELKLLED
ncbi:MAG: tetratricopeptide repeat protein [Clostridia bacterium]|nr:tetratricopeptide repeat protein [Clostridia bacterium]